MIDEAYKLVESFQKATGQPVSKILCQLKKSGWKFAQNGWKKNCRNL